MSNSRKIASPFFIGVFVIVGMTLTIAGVLWLGASKFFEENTLYSTYFDGSVQGVERGQAVKYQGVPVGSIKFVRLAPDGKLIEIVMEIDRKMAVSEKMRVKIEMASLAGGKFLQLFYPDNAKSADIHPNFDFKPPFPLIHSAPSAIEELRTDLVEALNKLLEIDTRSISDETVRFLQASSTFLEDPHLAQTIENFDLASKTLTGILREADTSKIIQNVQTSTEQLKRTTAQLEKMASEIDAEVKNLQLSNRVEKAFSKYDSLIVNAQKTVGLLRDRAEQSLLNASDMMNELRATNRELRKSLRSINDNPSQTFFSEPPPKEK